MGGSGGALVPPDNYWPKIAEICRRHDIVLIADEVLTGFGRTGKRFAIEHWGVTPDLLVLGKGLSGGYAMLSGVATSDAFCDRLTDAGIQPMYHTYGAHPAACAASVKVLEIFRREKLMDRITALSGTFEAKMRQLEAHPNVAEVRGRGYLYAIEVVKDRETLTRYPQAEMVTMRLAMACLERNCSVFPGGTGEVRDILQIAPPFTISEAEMDVIVDTLEAALDEVCVA